MSDTFDVTAAWSKASYVPGETVTATINGTNAHTTEDSTTTETVSLEIAVVSGSGAKSTITAPAAQIVTTVEGETVSEEVLIDTAEFDTTQGGRTWVVSEDRKSITATA